MDLKLSSNIGIPVCKILFGSRGNEHCAEEDFVWVKLFKGMLYDVFIKQYHF
jgi:hypothetical protein